ncbi:hypothetical protein AB0D47_39860 [Streptomyces sp. NPDC048376]|uniref:hypothetical protein n=1 Tax=Streptomyces sp. NPDC048376 TaxID=3154926 RepID=UPI0034216EE8
MIPLNTPATEGALLVRENLSGIAAAEIYADYQKVFPHWPEVPPPGLKVAVDSHTMGYVKEAVYREASGQVLAQGVAMATLNVRGAAAGPAVTAGVPEFLVDPGMNLTDPTNQQFLREESVSVAQTDVTWLEHKRTCQGRCPLAGPET